MFYSLVERLNRFVHDARSVYSESLRRRSVYALHVCVCIVLYKDSIQLCEAWLV